MQRDRREAIQMFEDGWSRLGQWSTAEGNYWEATVREELETAVRAARLPAAPSPDDLDRTASMLALGLKELWEVTPRFPVPAGFEPEWLLAEAPGPPAPACPSCGIAMAPVADENHGGWSCPGCGLVRLR